MATKQLSRTLAKSATISPPITTSTPSSQPLVPASYLPPNTHGNRIGEPLAPGLRPAPPQPPTRTVYTYYNIRTKQTLHSLTRILSNKLSMKQLPFVGKQTKPAVLRKDVWLPLMTVVFPESPTAMYRTHACYRQLLEYKQRHILGPGKADVMDESGRGYQQKKLSYTLMNQRHNAIADLAWQLRTWPEQTRALLESLQERKERNDEQWRDLPRKKRKAAHYNAARLEMLKACLEDVEKGTVEIHWLNILDKEYAESWPEGVKHVEARRDMRDRHWAPDPLQPHGERKGEYEQLAEWRKEAAGELRRPALEQTAEEYEDLEDDLMNEEQSERSAQTGSVAIPAPRQIGWAEALKERLTPWKR